MSEHERAGAERIFEELKEEHRRALEDGDIEALQRVQAKLEKLLERNASFTSDASRRKVLDQQLETANQGLTKWLVIAVAAVAALGSIGYMLS